MTRSWSGRLLAASSLVLSVSWSARADAPGVLWESTSQMVMEGLPFRPKPSTLKYCAAADSSSPPPSPPGQNCTVSNMQRDGSKVTWDTQCTGEMDMTGHGEINYDGTDAYAGEINMSAEGVNMKITLSGKKLGECDNPIG
jgi:hypothetical protein